MDDRRRKPAERKSVSLYILINTIIPKYASNPSQIKSGMKIIYQDAGRKSSYFRTDRTENAKMATMWSHISNDVIPSHFTSSFSVNSMMMWYCGVEKSNGSLIRHKCGFMKSVVNVFWRTLNSYFIMLVWGTQLKIGFHGGVTVSSWHVGYVNVLSISSIL